MESDKAFFRRRAEQERVAAGNVAHAAARMAHLALADRYDDLAHAITAREYYLGLDLFEPTAAA
jgi:hypothetical protein